MPVMTEEQWRAFLVERPRAGKLAVVRADGAPHVTPIWFDLDGEEIVFTTHETGIKGRSVLRDPRVCLCVDDDTPPFAFVIVNGTARVSTDPDELLYWATRLGGRYMGAGRAEEYGRRNAVPGELVVRVTPTKVVAADKIAD
jgi:PPOX class probable F420-dependent enzyme